jgi:hypothetical protein
MRFRTAAWVGPVNLKPLETPMIRLTNVLAAVAVLACSASAALALTTPPPAVPEPGTLALLAAGGVTAAGLYASKKWRGRK